jgi:hypothetical protein
MVKQPGSQINKNINMKKYIYLNLLVISIAGLLTSCSQDYITGGEINSNKVNMTTFELLSKMEETKTVAILFDRAGMKATVNGDVTVIAPNQWSVNRYLRRRNNQALRTNPAAVAVTINDISANELKKMGMYILPGKLWSETIPEEGKFLKTLDGSDVFLSVDRTGTDPGPAWDGSGSPGEGYQYSNFMAQNPRIVHILFKRGANWEMTPLERSALSNTYDNPECDQMYRMYVSDILTTNGVVHVLYEGDSNYSDHYYYHSLFFFGQRTDDKL